MINQDLFAITYNADLTEGRGHTIILGYTKTFELAKTIASDPRFSRYCCMGHQNPDDWKHSVSQKPVLIFESVDEPFELEEQKLREKALAKLSQEERRVLGLI